MRTMRPWQAIAAAALLLPSATGVAWAQSSDDEPDLAYRTTFCTGMEIDSPLPAKRGVVDCVSATHAIAVDWADNWRVAIGDAFGYAFEKNLYPGLILICRGTEDSCRGAVRSIVEEINAYGVAGSIWLCPMDGKSLEECANTTIEAAR